MSSIPGSSATPEPSQLRCLQVRKQSSTDSAHSMHVTTTLLHYCSVCVWNVRHSFHLDNLSATYIAHERWTGSCSTVWFVQVGTLLASIMTLASYGTILVAMVYIYVHQGENRYGRPCKKKKWGKEKNNKLQGLLHDWAFLKWFVASYTRQF